MAYLRRPKNSRNWHVVYHVASKRREWSTKTPNHGVAKQILKKWEYDRLIGQETRPGRLERGSLWSSRDGVRME